MMNSEQTKVASNTSWFTLALILQKIISFVYFTYLARQLGAASLGKYILALSYIAVFSIIIDFGTNHFITREVAKSKNISQKLYANILGFKLFTSFLAVGLLALTVNILGYDIIIKQLVYIASVLMVIESLVISSYAFMRGHHNLRYESVATVGVQTLVIIFGVLALHYSDDLRILMLVLIGSNFLNLLFISFLLMKKLKLKIKINIDLIYWKNVFKIILPFALAASFTKIYASFDQVLLSKLASEQSLGFYAVAYKLTFATQFIPLALVAALYPAMSTYYKNDQQLLNKSFTRSIYYLLIIAIPISSIVIGLAPEFVTTLYGADYYHSVLPLQIMIVSLSFLFINFPVGSLLNAADKQSRNTLNIAIAMILNIILNILLIPKLGAVGAATASTISTILLLILGWFSITSLVKYDKKYIFSIAIKSLLAGFITWLAIYFLKSEINWLISGVLGAVLYLIIQILLKTITNRDIKQFSSSFFKKRK